MNEALIIQREIEVAAPAATVFAFLTDPEKILRWVGTEANVEAQPGGIYLVNVAGRSTGWLTVSAGRATIRCRQAPAS